MTTFSPVSIPYIDSDKNFSSKSFMTCKEERSSVGGDTVNLPFYEPIFIAFRAISMNANWTLQFSGVYEGTVTLAVLEDSGTVGRVTLSSPGTNQPLQATLRVPAGHTYTLIGSAYWDTQS